MENAGAAAAESPMEGHANLAIPTIEALAIHLEGESMRNAIAAVPVFDELGKLTQQKPSKRCTRHSKL